MLFLDNVFLCLLSVSNSEAINKKLFYNINGLEYESPLIGKTTGKNLPPASLSGIYQT